MQFNVLIRQLAERLKLPALVVGPDGRCAIRFDDVVVRFSHAPAADAFDLSARIGAVDLGDPEVVDALEALRESSAAACWDSSGQVSLRQRFWLAALSLPHFVRALERFVDQTEHWRRRLGAR
ncbi:type III secretion system chaperone [Ramlibacter sp. AN1015]|uniref:type III secretion system chaperone n=1 Tax=Ramlibacter sp. AN1015 TaxID=3133428 RepID=UPI0030C643AB